MEKLRFVFVFVFVFIASKSSHSNTFRLIRFSSCMYDEKNPMHTVLNITKTSRNKYLLNGKLIIDETIHGPIEVVVRSSEM